MALTEFFTNEAATVLSSAVTAGAGTMAVSSSTGFPSAPFKARVTGALTAGGSGTEYVLVTAVSGTTWTITRGFEPPYNTGLGFASAAVVEHVVTAAGLYEAGPYVNVKSPRFGAKGDGVTDDTTAINAAITYAAGLGISSAGSGASTNGLTGAWVYMPPGVYMHSGSIVKPSRVHLQGAGPDVTTLRRTADVPSITIYGTASADVSRNWYGGLYDMTVDGNDHWITGIDMVYVSQHRMRNVYIYNARNIGLDVVEVWDSSFTDVYVHFCGGIALTEQPAIYVRSTRAASGFGSGTDSSNELKFTNVHLEHFRAGAIKIAPGFGAALNGPNGIYFTNIKTETAYVSNTTPLIHLAAQTERVHLKNVYSYAAALLDGAAVPVIQNDSVGQTSIRDVYAANGASATITSAVNLNISGAGMCVLDGAYGSYTTAPTVAHVNVAQAGDLEISNIRTNIGTRITGFEIDSAERMLGLTADLTTTSTTAANIATLTFTNVTPGTYRVTLDGMYRSSVNTTGPRFGVGGTCTATGTGVVTMGTAAGAATATEITAISTTFGVNPGTGVTSFIVQMSFLAVVTVSGTLGVRWNELAASTGTLRAGATAIMTRVR